MKLDIILEIRDTHMCKRLRMFLNIISYVPVCEAPDFTRDTIIIGPTVMNINGLSLVTLVAYEWTELLDGC